MDGLKGLACEAPTCQKKPLCAVCHAPLIIDPDGDLSPYCPRFVRPDHKAMLERASALQAEKEP